MLPTDLRRVGEILLADEHERPLGHGAPVDRLLVGDDLVEAATEMDRAGLAGRRGRPRNVALDREIDLERAGP